MSEFERRPLVAPLDLLTHVDRIAIAEHPIEHSARAHREASAASRPIANSAGHSITTVVPIRIVAVVDRAVVATDGIGVLEEERATDQNDAVNHFTLSTGKRLRERPIGLDDAAHRLRYAITGDLRQGIVARDRKPLSRRVRTNNRNPTGSGQTEQ